MKKNGKKNLQSIALPRPVPNFSSDSTLHFTSRGFVREAEDEMPEVLDIEDNVPRGAASC